MRLGDAHNRHESNMSQKHYARQRTDSENVCIYKRYSGNWSCGPAKRTLNPWRKHRTALQATATAQGILRDETGLTFNFSKEIHITNSTNNTALAIASVVVALLLLLFGGAMTTGTMFSGGMMGSGSMGGISWMWLPTLLVVVLGVALFSAIVGKK